MGEVRAGGRRGLPRGAAEGEIVTTSGVQNEAGGEYARISLLGSDDNFDVLMERLAELVHADKYDDVTRSELRRANEHDEQPHRFE